jgi:BA14K-like protein
MRTLRHIGYALLAALLTTAIVTDTADARRGGGGGGGGGGMRGGGGGGGGGFSGSGVRGSGLSGANRVANIGGPRPTHPIAGLPNRPDRPVGPGRPGWGNPGWGNGGWGNAGWGWPAAGLAVGAGLAYANGCGSYYNNSSCYDYSYQGPSDDAVAACAQRFRSYDVASQTYLSNSGKRVRCP